MSDIKPFLIPPPKDTSGQHPYVFKNDFYKMYPAPRIMTEGMKFLRSMSYTPLQEWVDTYQRSLTPIQEMFNENRAGAMASALNNTSFFSGYFENFISPDIFCSNKNCGAFSGEQIGVMVHPFLSEIDNIRIHPDYVEIPKSLVPEDFSQITTNESLQNNANTKRLNRSDALAVLSLILAVLFWLFPSPLSQEKLPEEITSPPLTEEQGELILNYFDRVCGYMESISSNSNQVTQENGLPPLNTPPDTATPSSAIQQNHADSSTYDNIQPPKATE